MFSNQIKQQSDSEQRHVRKKCLKSEKAKTEFNFLPANPTEPSNVR